MVDALHPQRRNRNIDVFGPRHGALPCCTGDAASQKCNPAFADQPRPRYGAIARNLANIGSHRARWFLSGKLVAILVSDVVGYSRLTGADEDRTLAVEWG